MKTTQLFSSAGFGKMLFALLLFQVFVTYAQPAGYYDGASGQSGEVLHSTLYNIIKGHTVRSYDQLWTDFQSTDDKANGEVWDMYTDIPGGTPTYVFTFITDQCGNYSFEGDCYNREHSMPKSWFGDATPMYSDLFHLVPTDGKVNGMRGNYPYGEVGASTYTSSNGCQVGASDYPGYSGTVFEPIDAYKGDFARNYFYMATRYKNVVSGWSSPMLGDDDYPVFTEWALNMLMEWHTNDPVSPKETERNNAVYALQNNRNPFIDHPEYVGLIWGDGLAPEPSNHVTDFSANTITLQWTDATGAILPDGYLLRMSAVSFEDIEAPEDGTPVTDNETNKNVAFGIQKCIFGGLTPGNVYYFKMFAFKGSGASIDYKIDNPPQSSEVAQ